ncbi:MAG: hypothetical protein QM820_31215 [Minicystis sp.]
MPIVHTSPHPTSVSPPRPTQRADAPAPPALAGSAVCRRSTSVLTLDQGTFEGPISACLDAQTRGMKVRCTVSGKAQGVRSVSCNQAVEGATVEGTFRWHWCGQ